MIRVAFAGFRHGHILALYEEAKKSDLVKIVGAYEADEKTKKAVAEQNGVAFTYDSYDALFADKEVDAVAIGDYYSIRGSLAIRALESGKHVIADKPLCTDIKEEEKIRALAEEKGLKVYLMLDLRFDDRFYTVKQLMKENAVGRVTLIRFGGQHPLLRSERPSWYFEEGKHGGVINDIAIHGIDVIRYMCGIEPKKTLMAKCWNAYAEDVPHFLDSGIFTAEMSGGEILSADVSYSSPDGMRYSYPQYWEFEIFGLLGILRFGRNMKNIELYKKDSDRVEIIEPKPIGKKMIEDFVDVILGKKRTVMTTEDVLCSTRITLEIQAAADQA